MPMARRYRRETHGVKVPWPQLSVQGPSRRSGLHREVSAQVTLNGKCKAAGCNASELRIASSYECVRADRIVALGRLAGGGDQRTLEPSPRTGVLEVARCESLTTLGREASYDVHWPWATASYKGNRNRCRSYEDSAGFIVPFEGVGQHNPTRGKGPCFSQWCSMWLRQCRLPKG